MTSGGLLGCRSCRAAGASPLFPPQYATADAAKTALLHVVRREPKAFGIPGTRWTLAKIHEVCDWLRTTTPGGMCRRFDRLGIHWKRGRERGREHVHRPDPDYLAKLADSAVFSPPEADAPARSGRSSSPSMR